MCRTCLEKQETPDPFAIAIGEQAGVNLTDYSVNIQPEQPVADSLVVETGVVAPPTPIQPAYPVSDSLVIETTVTPPPAPTPAPPKKLEMPWWLIIIVIILMLLGRRREEEKR